MPSTAHATAPRAPLETIEHLTGPSTSAPRRRDAAAGPPGRDARPAPPRRPAPPQRFRVLYAVPAGARAGDLVSAALPNGATASARVPSDRPATFASFWPAFAPGEHACEVCGRAFKKETHLRLHARTHTRSVKTVAAPDRPTITPHPDLVAVAEVAVVATVRDVDDVDESDDDAAVDDAVDAAAAAAARAHRCVLCSRSFPTKVALQAPWPSGTF